MKKVKELILSAGVALLLSSCVMTQAPLSGKLYTHVKGPVTATSNSKSSKVGSSQAVGFFGIAIGNASIENAAKSAGITKIHHVDYRVVNFLGLFGSYKIYVYGE